MTITLRCTGCCVMKLRDELAGKKVRCPRCKSILIVPEEQGEEAEEELAEATPKKQHVQQNVRRKTGKTGRLQREEPALSRKNKLRIGRDEDREAPRAGKPGKYKPCPKCGAE